MHTELLNLILVVLGLAVAVQLVCGKLRLPAIVGFLATGLLAGPGGLNFVPGGHDELAEIGVVLLLFTIGVEFSFRRLAQMRRYVLIGGAFQVLITILAIALIGFGLLRVGTGQAVFFGFLIAMSSSAILFRLLQERSELESPHGRLAVGISIFQDLASVIMMLSLPLLAGQGGSLLSAIGKITWQGAAILLMVYVMARYIVPLLLNSIARTRSRELFLLATLLICLGIPWLTVQIGLSIGIGAFLAGLIIAETEYSHQALAGVMPFKDVFSAVFFISIGILLDLRMLVEMPGVIVGATAVVLLLKLLITAGAGLLLGFPLRTALIGGLLLANTGEFTFVIAALGLPLGLLTAEQHQICIAVSVLTMAATPLLMRLAPHLTRAADRLPMPNRVRQGGMADPFTPPETLRDHLIIVGYGVIGRSVANAARTTGIPFVIIEMNHETVRRERGHGVPIIGGDATQETLLEHAQIGSAQVLVIAVPDGQETRQITQVARRLAPKLQIIARTRFAGQIGELSQIGADVVVPDEFEAAVARVALTLRRHMVPRAEIERAIAELREGSYEGMRHPASEPLALSELEQAHTSVEVASVRMPDDSPLLGKSLAELDLRRKHQLTLLAIRRAGQVIANPAGGETLQRDDILVLFGASENIARLHARGA